MTDTTQPQERDIVDELRGLQFSSSVAEMVDVALRSADEILRLRLDLRSCRTALPIEQKRHAKIRQEIHRLRAQPSPREGERG